MKNLNFKSFYIFNPDLRSKKRKPSEDEVQNIKILYYFPKEEDGLIKRSNTGIIEGTLGFLCEFEQKDDNFIYVELQKYFYIAKKFEENFYLTFILEKSPESQSNTENFNSNLETKKKWFKIFMDNFYDMFTLWNGNLKSIFFSDNLFSDPNKPAKILQKEIISDKEKFDIREDEEKYPKLYHIITDFLFSYKENLSFNKIPFLNNILYFPLTETSFTKILLSTQRLSEKLSEMKYISIVYKGYLLHNDCPLDTFSLLFNTFFSNLDGSYKFQNFSKPDFVLTNTVYSNDFESHLKYDKKHKSDFRKGFEMQQISHILGIQKQNVSNYNLFIPKIFLKENNSFFKLVLFHFNGLFFFIFLKEDFNYFSKIHSLINIEKWVKRYFEDHISILENLYVHKFTKNDTNNFAYFNNSNRSIKLSSNFFQKKTKIIEAEKFSTLIKIIRCNYHNEISAITKLKSYYVYFLISKLTTYYIPTISKVSIVMLLNYFNSN